MGLNRNQKGTDYVEAQTHDSRAEVKSSSIRAKHSGWGGAI